MSNFTKFSDGHRHVFDYILLLGVLYHNAGPLKKKHTVVNDLVLSLSKTDVMAFLAKVVGFAGTTKNNLTVEVLEKGDTKLEVGQLFTIKDYFQKDKYRSVIEVTFRACPAALVRDEIHESYGARNEIVVSAKVPCTLGGGTHDNAPIPLEIENIDQALVVDGKDFENFELVKNVKDICEEEGFDTTSTRTALGEAITGQAIFKTFAGISGCKALIKVMYGNELEKSDIPSIDAACAMLEICQWWSATALKYRVAMYLMEYKLIAEHFARLYVASSMYESPELQYACLFHLSNLSLPEKRGLRQAVNSIKEQAWVVEDGILIPLRTIELEDLAKLQIGINILPSPLIGQYEASVLGTKNEVVLQAETNSKKKTMEKVNAYLGEFVTGGGKRKYEAFLSNVDSARVFAQAKEEALEPVFDKFRAHTEGLKNGYESDYETLRNVCVENEATTKEFRSDIKKLIEPFSKEMKEKLD